MTRKFIAALLSLSLAMTAMTTAPARADEDVGKIIAGLAVLGILSQVLKNKNNDEVVTQRDTRRYDAYPSRRNPNREMRPRRQAAKIAPEKCLVNQWTHRGNIRVYGAKCMERSTRAQLPRSCERRVESRQGARRFYSPQCLRQKGWQA
ncbi:hypothetical protein [Litoreibacter janthinus]|uniref:Uncharacterized protein n=1 Tax=Litoreibacter janthinus TaxID=670154 RepID=A0A1I6G1S5_9RHOB|nr:hypothetical protein [Litoreibacter janthinus]SFR36145.1 hypothetical protein SAMN04488002_0751 [Litoreibacter janthinus]